LMMPSAWL